MQTGNEVIQRQKSKKSTSSEDEPTKKLSKLLEEC
jgi:hypothetical protein